MTVVVDRYYYSGVVYSAAKRNPSLPLKWARDPEVGLPRPDICIFLDITPEITAERGGYGQERYEKREMQERVRKLFHEFFDEDDEREDVQKVDASRSVDEVTDDIQHILSRLMEVETASLAAPLRSIR